MRFEYPEILPIPGLYNKLMENSFEGQGIQRSCQNNKKNYQCLRIRSRKSSVFLKCFHT